ncbi:hypothetical protein [Archangium sp.]|uniref:hypothetical protein n=1 Tax=Archangium sp. TaxID=1872627 RepID=UPI00286D217C|nr:hypothetical protein [Archangium sp.]
MGIGPTFELRKRSAWTYDSSSTAGLGLGPVAASGGSLVFKDPSKRETQFRYVAGGFGVGAGLKKLPKVERIADPKKITRGGGVTGPVGNLPNFGYIYVMDGCKGDDLEADDFVGACCMIEVGVSIFLGYSGAAVLLNVDPVALLALLANPLSQRPLRPAAMFLTHGGTAGIQGGIGLSEQVGYLWRGSPDAADSKPGLKGRTGVMTQGAQQISRVRGAAARLPRRRR